MPGRRTFLPVCGRKSGDWTGNSASAQPCLSAFRRWISGCPEEGLREGALHDVIEGGPAGEFSGSATLFTAGIAARLRGPVLWCLNRRDLFAPGLVNAGLHPDRVIYRRDLSRAGHPARHGRGTAGKRSGGGDRRGHPARADCLAPAPAGGRNVRCAGFHPPPLVECRREGTHRSAECRYHPMAHHAFHVPRAAGAGAWPGPLAGRSSALPRRRTPFLDSRGLR